MCSKDITGKLAGGLKKVYRRVSGESAYCEPAGNPCFLFSYSGERTGNGKVEWTV